MREVSDKNPRDPTEAYQQAAEIENKPGSTYSYCAQQVLKGLTLTVGAIGAGWLLNRIVGQQSDSETKPLDETLSNQMAASAAPAITVATTVLGLQSLRQPTSSSLLPLVLGAAAHLPQSAFAKENVSPNKRLVEVLPFGQQGYFDSFYDYASQVFSTASDLHMVREVLENLQQKGAKLELGQLKEAMPPHIHSRIEDMTSVLSRFIDSKELLFHKVKTQTVKHISVESKFCHLHFSENDEGLHFSATFSEDFFQNKWERDSVRQILGENVFEIFPGVFKDLSDLDLKNLELSISPKGEMKIFLDIENVSKISLLGSSYTSRVELFKHAENPLSGRFHLSGPHLNFSSDLINGAVSATFHTKQHWADPISLSELLPGICPGLPYWIEAQLPRVSEASGHINLETEDAEFALSPKVKWTFKLLDQLELKLEEVKITYSLQGGNSKFHIEARANGYPVELLQEASGNVVLKVNIKGQDLTFIIDPEAPFNLSLSSKIDLEIIASFLNLKLPKIQGLDLLKVKLEGGALSLDADRSHFTYSGPSSLGHIDLVLTVSKGNDFAYGVRLSEFKTHPTIGSLTDNMKVQHGSEYLPENALHISKGTSLVATVDPNATSLPGIKELGKLVGVGGPVDFVVIQEGEHFVLTSQALAQKIDLAGIARLEEPSLKIFSRTTDIVLGGKIPLKLAGKELIFSGDLGLGSDGFLNGKLSYEKQFKLAAELYLSKVGLTLSGTSDVGFSSDLTLIPPSKAKQKDIGRISAAIGAGPIPKFEAKFPEDFVLSIKELFRVITGQNPGIPDWLSPVEFSGFMNESEFRPLTLVFSPQELDFQLIAKLSLFKAIKMQAEFMISKTQGVKLDAKMWPVTLGNFFELTHASNREYGPEVKMSCPDVLELSNAAAWKKVQLTFSGRVFILGIEETTTGWFNDQEMALELSSKIDFVNAIKFNSASKVIISPKDMFVLMNRDLEVMVNVKLPKVGPVPSVQVIGLDVKGIMLFDTRKKLLEFDLETRIFGRKVKFALQTSPTEYRDIPKMIAAHVEKEAANLYSSTGDKLEQIREEVEKFGKKVGERVVIVQKEITHFFENEVPGFFERDVRQFFEDNIEDLEVVVINSIEEGILDAKEATARKLVNGKEAVSRGWVDAREAAGAGWISGRDAVGKGWIGGLDAVANGWLDAREAVGKEWVSGRDAVANGWIDGKEAVEKKWLDAREAVGAGWVSGRDAVAKGWIDGKEAVEKKWLGVKEAIDMGKLSLDDAVNIGHKLEDLANAGVDSAKKRIQKAAAALAKKEEEAKKLLEKPVEIVEKPVEVVGNAVESVRKKLRW